MNNGKKLRKAANRYGGKGKPAGNTKPGKPRRPVPNSGSY